MEIASLIVAIAAAVLSGGALWYTRRSTRAAEQSADRARETASRDQDRRHDELMPQLRVDIDRPGQGAHHCTMTVELVGPPELCELDSMTITIRDDRPGRANTTPRPGDITPEMIAAQI